MHLSIPGHLTGPVLALDQRVFGQVLAVLPCTISRGHKELLQRTAATPLGNDTSGNLLKPLALDGKSHPRIITLGGDHTITLPLLRSIHSVYGPISVIHFDSHLDTWKPAVFGGSPSEQAAINHGTYFYWASQEGLIRNGSSIASIRFLSTPLRALQ